MITHSLTIRSSILASFAVFLVGAASCSRDDAAIPALAFTASDTGLKWGACPPPFTAGCEIGVLRGDPDKANADVFLRVPSQYEIPAHWHTSSERMILVSGALQVTYKGQSPTTLTAGNYAYGPAKLPHKGTCVSSDACTLFIAFDKAVDAHAFDGAF
jgi:quercetin dioxygenase-like cupin family protein